MAGVDEGKGKRRKMRRTKEWKTDRRQVGRTEELVTLNPRRQK